MKPGLYFKNGARNCIIGAYEEYVAVGGGIIRYINNHAYFIPPDAKPDDICGNLGERWGPERLIKAQYYPPLTVREALLLGIDITDDTVKSIGEGIKNRQREAEEDARANRPEIG